MHLTLSKRGKYINMNAATQEKRSLCNFSMLESNIISSSDLRENDLSTLPIINDCDLANPFKT